MQSRGARGARGAGGRTCHCGIGHEPEEEKSFCPPKPSKQRPHTYARLEPEIGAPTSQSQNFGCPYKAELDAQHITTHAAAKYKVMGVDSDLWDTLTHIR